MDAFALARELGLASVPHAGEVAGAASVQGAIEALHADRIRHGIRAVEDPGLVREIAGRGLVLDVCPLSNLRTGAVATLAEHPLPTLLDAGVRCSISTDDPAMFDTDLGRDYAAACTWGHSPRVFYEAGVVGALCDEATQGAAGSDRRGVRLGCARRRTGFRRLSPGSHAARRSRYIRRVPGGGGAVVVRRACWAVPAAVLAGVLAACGGGHRTAPAAGTATAQAVAPSPAAGAEQLVAATPAAADLPPRLVVEGGLLATGDLSVVHDLTGATAPLYALVPPGPDVVPAGEARETCEITTSPDDGTDATRLQNAAAFANLQACQGTIGCGQLVVASIAGQSRAATEATLEKIAKYNACLERLQVGSFAGPPVDGRFLLQPAPSSATASLPVSVIVYPSADAFTTSLRQVAAGGAFRTSTVPGRFAPSSIPACALQFYPATAAALAWCDDAYGGHDPEHDATVGRIAAVLATGRLPADAPALAVP